MSFHNRFLPVSLRTKQMIEEGRLGDILEFRAFHLHSGSADPKAPLKWKFFKGKAKGPTLEQGVRVQVLLEKVNESEKGGKWIQL